MAPRVLVVGCSLNPESRSQVLAREARERIAALGADTEFLDLREVELPHCDGFSRAFLDSAVADSILKADAILLAVPIYNYDVNAATKTLLEMTGKAWTGKIVGFLCSAGGKGSFMSVMSFATSLMLDFRCLIIPRFVYTTGACYPSPGVVEDEILGRLDRLCAETVRLATALGS